MWLGSLLHAIGFPTDVVAPPPDVFDPPSQAKRETDTKLAESDKAKRARVLIEPV
jgi:hypothetical protein